MRELHLDYRRTNTPRQHWVGMVALVLVLAAGMQLWQYYRQISAQVEHLELLAVKIEHKLHPGIPAVKPSAAEAQQSDAEIKAAKEVMLQLNLPWHELFAVLEESNGGDIALLGIEPNLKKGLVQVSGEAKDFAALFAYIRLLQASTPMSDVHLKNHQIQEQNPEKPIHFTLDASWIVKH